MQLINLSNVAGLLVLFHYLAVCNASPTPIFERMFKPKYDQPPLSLSEASAQHQSLLNKADVHFDQTRQRKVDALSHASDLATHRLPISKEQSYEKPEGLKLAEPIDTKAYYNSATLLKSFNRPEAERYLKLLQQHERVLSKNGKHLAAKEARVRIVKTKEAIKLTKNNPQDKDHKEYIKYLTNTNGMTAKSTKEGLRQSKKFQAEIDRINKKYI